MSPSTMNDLTRIVLEDPVVDKDVEQNARHLEEKDYILIKFVRKSYFKSSK